MLPDQTDKRRNLATNAVIHATQLLNSLRALQELAAERAQAGNFTDADFEGTSLKHLTPYMVGVLLDNVVPAVANTVNDPANLPILLQIRS